MLVLSRKINEKIVLGNDIEISIMEIKGDVVKIGVQAPKDVKVFRKEIFDAIQAENQAAASSGAKLPELDFGQLANGNPNGGPSGFPSGSSSGASPK
jgi:carbon storage regulator